MKAIILLVLTCTFCFAQTVEVDLSSGFGNIGDTITFTVYAKKSTLKLFDNRNVSPTSYDTTFKFCYFEGSKSVYKFVATKTGTSQYYIAENWNRIGVRTDAFTFAVMPNGLGEYDYSTENGKRAFYSLNGIKINDPDNYEGVMVERSEGKSRKILRLP